METDDGSSSPTRKTPTFDSELDREGIFDAETSVKPFHNLEHLGGQNWLKTIIQNQNPL